jgi:predicted nucleotidyltransferase
MFSLADRDAVVERAVKLLSDDQRVEAAMLTGSLGRGGSDRWSDIDLAAAIAEDADIEEVTTDWEALAYREWPVVHHYAIEFGTTRVRGFLIRNGLLLDLGFTPIGDFEAWAPVRMLFDRTGRATEVAERWTPWSPTPDWRGEAGFAAHDVLHACVAANRGRPWQSLYFLQRIRNRALALASERHGWDSDDFTRVDDVPEDETKPLEATLVSSLERDLLINAVDRATRAFLDELGRHDHDLAERLAEPLLAMVAESKGSAADRSSSASDDDNLNPTLEQ